MCQKLTNHIFSLDVMKFKLFTVICGMNLYSGIFLKHISVMSKLVTAQKLMAAFHGLTSEQIKKNFENLLSSGIILVYFRVHFL